MFNYESVCNYCDYIMKSDKIYRFKVHLSGNDTNINCKSMSKCSSKSKEINFEINEEKIVN